MAAEIALMDILRDDATLNTHVVGRLFPNQRSQGSSLPAIVVRRQGGTIPSDTKDGVSTLDTEFVQVLMYDNDVNRLTLTIEARVRSLCDRIAPGMYNGVNIQSSQFEDDDTWAEELVDSQTHIIEHIYKVRVKR